jgi:hypothetical protein
VRRRALVDPVIGDWCSFGAVVAAAVVGEGGGAGA